MAGFQLAPGLVVDDDKDPYGLQGSQNSVPQPTAPAPAGGNPFPSQPGFESIGSPFAPGAERQGLMDLEQQRQQAIAQAFNLANTFGGGVQALEQAKAAGLANLRQQAGRAIAGSFGGAGRRVAGGGGTAALRQSALDSGTAQANFQAQAAQQIQQQREAAEQAQLNALLFQREAGTQFQDAQQQMSVLGAELAQIDQLAEGGQKEKLKKDWLVRVMTILPPQFQSRFLASYGIDPQLAGGAG